MPRRTLTEVPRATRNPAPPTADGPALEPWQHAHLRRLAIDLGRPLGPGDLANIGWDARWQRVVVYAPLTDELQAVLRARATPRHPR